MITKVVDALWGALPWVAFAVSTYALGVVRGARRERDRDRS